MQLNPMSLKRPPEPEKMRKRCRNAKAIVKIGLQGVQGFNGENQQQ